MRDLQVHLEPRAPSPREILLEEALEADLLQMSDPCLLLALETLAKLALPLLLRLDALCRHLRRTERRELRLERAHRLLQRSALCLLLGKPLLLRHLRESRCLHLPRHLGRLPVLLPMDEGRDHLRTREAGDGRLKQALLVSERLPLRVPGRPAAGEAALDETAHANIREMLDALLLLLLELLVHLALHLRLLGRAGKGSLTRGDELQLEALDLILQLGLNRAVTRDLGLELLLLGHRLVEDALRKRDALPMLEGLTELRLRKPRSAALEQAHEACTALVPVVPRVPRSRDLHALDAAHRALMKMGDTLLTLLLELELLLSLHLHLLALALKSSLTRGGKLALNLLQ